jgi:hypothetical protein
MLGNFLILGVWRRYFFEVSLRVIFFKTIKSPQKGAFIFLWV